MVRIVPDAAERVVRLRAARAVASAHPSEVVVVGTAAVRRATGRPGQNGAATAPEASVVVVTDRAATVPEATVPVATVPVANVAGANVAGATDRVGSAAV